MADQSQKLLLEVKNAEAIERLTAELEKERTTIRSLAKDLHDGTINLQQYEQAAKPAATQVVGLKNQINALRASTRDMNRFALEGAHALQDFAQGGVGGVLNNIPRLVEFVGGPMGLGAAISGLAVAAYVATPVIKSLWGALTDGGEAIPQGASALERLNEALKTSKDRLDEMKAGWGGSAGEVAAYNKQLAETARLEGEVEKAKAEQARLDAMRKAEAEKGTDKRATEAAQAAVQAAGGVDKVISDITVADRGHDYNVATMEIENLTRARDEAIARAGSSLAAQAGIRKRYGEAIAGAQADRDAIEAAARERAAGVVARAGANDPAALAELNRRFPQAGFDRATPEYFARADAEDEGEASAYRESQRRESQRREGAADQKQFEAGAYDYTLQQRRLRQQAQEMDDQAEFEAYRGTVDRNQRAAADTREQQQTMGQAREAVQIQRDVREGGQIRRIAAREFDANLNDDETAAALKRARELVEAKWRPDFAARQAISEVVAELIGSVQRATEATFMQGTQVEYMRMQLNQVRQMQQRSYTLMTRGGAGG